MARNLSVSGSDNGLGRGVAAHPFLTLHREMSRLFDDVFRSTPVPFDQLGEAIVPQTTSARPTRSRALRPSFPAFPRRISMWRSTATSDHPRREEGRAEEGEEEGELLFRRTRLTAHSNAACGCRSLWMPGRSKHKPGC
jgi:hypothetical protein